MTSPPGKKTMDEEMYQRLEVFKDYSDFKGRIPCNYITGKPWSGVAKWALTNVKPDQMPEQTINTISSWVSKSLRIRKIQGLYKKEGNWEPLTVEDQQTEKMWGAFRTIRTHSDYLRFCQDYWKEPSPGFCHEEDDSARRCVVNCKNEDESGYKSVGKVQECLDHIMESHSHLKRQGVYCLVCSLQGHEQRFKTPKALGEHIQKDHEKMFIMYSMGPQDDQPLNAMKAWQAFAQLVISRTLNKMEDYLPPSFFNRPDPQPVSPFEELEPVQGGSKTFY